MLCVGPGLPESPHRNNLAVVTAPTLFCPRSPRNPLVEPQRGVPAPPCLSPPMAGGDPGVREPCGSSGCGMEVQEGGGLLETLWAAGMG